MSRILEFSNSQNQLVSFIGTHSTSNCPGFTLNEFNSSTVTYCTENLEIGQWYHVAVSVCGITGRLYLDGSLISQNNNTVRPENAVRTANYIGGNSFGEMNLNAKLDELRIYSRCMSQIEIVNLINSVNA